MTNVARLLLRRGGCELLRPSKRSNRRDPECLRQPNELQDVHATRAGFDVRQFLLGPAEFAGQVALGQSKRLSAFSEQIDQLPVLVPVDCLSQEGRHSGGRPAH